MNTRVLGAEFDYYAPASLDEALEILATKSNVKILAGGTDLIVKMKTAGVSVDNMLDIKKIDELNFIEVGKCCCGGLSIGAGAKLSEIEEFPQIKNDYLALYEALKAMASISVRNMGTMAGNLCNASPVSDTAGPAICFNAQITLKSKKGERKVDADKFFKGPGISEMADDEIMTSICMPALAANTGSAFLKKSRVKPDIAKMNATAVITNDNGKISNCRIAMGAMAATPLYLQDISQSLVGQTATKELFAKAAQEVADFVRPIDDNRTTAVYRKDITALVIEDVLQTAWKRAGGVL